MIVRVNQFDRKQPKNKQDTKLTRHAMNISVLVEPLPNKGFRAISGEPLNLKTEAPTREEAICKMRELIERRVANGAEVVSVSIGVSDHPLAEFAGMLKGDPLLEPWKRAMADYRRRRDPGQESP